MTNLIVEISKYLMILLMAVYTYTNFRFFSFPDMERKRRVCARQNRAMFAIHFLAYLVMFLKTEDEGMQAMLLAFYGAQVVFFLCYIYLYRLLYRNVSRLLVNNACMLLCVGFIMLTRLSMAKGLDKALRQFAIVVISAALAWLVPYIMERVWQLYKLQWVYAGAGLLILLVVWAAGNESFGAQLSLTIAGVSIQPSEFVKLTFVFFVASMFYQSTDFKTIFLTTAVAGAHVLVLVLSKDLGSALIFFVTYLLMLFVATGSWVYLITGSALGTGAALAAYQLFDHVRRRVAAWSNPWADIENKGYQITQSLFAIGTGGWFGMGLCQGMPGKIPVVEKDFFSGVGGDGSHFCHLRTSYLPGLFHPVHDDCSQNAGRVLQADCIWPGSGVYCAGIPDGWRGDQIHTVHRSDAALCQLRRKLHPGNLPAVWHYPGALHPETQR